MRVKIPGKIQTGAFLPLMIGVEQECLQYDVSFQIWRRLLLPI